MRNAGLRNSVETLPVVISGRGTVTSIEGVLELLPYLFALGDRRRTVPVAAPAVAAGGGESPQARARRRRGEDVARQSHYKL